MPEELKNLAHYQLLDSPFLMKDAPTRYHFRAQIGTAIAVEIVNGKLLWHAPYMRWTTQN